MPSARPRGTIVTLWSGSRPGTLRLTRAWPAAWYAVGRRARHGLREQGLAGPGRPDEQGALGKPAPQPLELLRIFEEVDDLLELLRRLVAARRVGEGDLRRVAREQLRLGFPEGERPVSALLHLPQHEDDEAEDEQVRQEAEEEYAERLLLLTRPHVDALLLERLYPLGAGLERQQRREMLRRAPPDRDGVLEVAFDLLPLGNFDRGARSPPSLSSHHSTPRLRRLPHCTQEQNLITHSRPPGTAPPPHSTARRRAPPLPPHNQKNHRQRPVHTHAKPHPPPPPSLT